MQILTKVNWSDEKDGTPAAIIQNFHFLTKEIQVSLQRMFLSEPGCKRRFNRLRG